MWTATVFKPARCGYTLKVTSQASYSPEYTTPTQQISRARSIIRPRSMTMSNCPCMSFWRCITRLLNPIYRAKLIIYCLYIQVSSHSNVNHYSTIWIVWQCMVFFAHSLWYTRQVHFVCLKNSWRFPHYLIRPHNRVESYLTICPLLKNDS
jgi:hypothetical protein